jgi:hypothetical protein
MRRSPPRAELPPREPELTAGARSRSERSARTARGGGRTPRGSAGTRPVALDRPADAHANWADVAGHVRDVSRAGAASGASPPASADRPNAFMNVLTHASPSTRVPESTARVSAAQVPSGSMQSSARIWVRKRARRCRPHPTFARLPLGLEAVRKRRRQARGVAGCALRIEDLDAHDAGELLQGGSDFVGDRERRPVAGAAAGQADPRHAA